MAFSLGSIGSSIGGFFSGVGGKLKSGAGIVGTNIKNSFSSESLHAFVDGFSKGGLGTAITNAAATTTMLSVDELSKKSNTEQARDYLKELFTQGATEKAVNNVASNVAQQVAPKQEVVAVSPDLRPNVNVIDTDRFTPQQSGGRFDD